jgi:predicted permease
MFTNVGPVGMPLIVLAFGAEGLAPAVLLLVISNLLHFTLGSAVMNGRVDWRMVYANPLVWAPLLGVTSMASLAAMKAGLPDRRPYQRNNCPAGICHQTYWSRR